MQSYQQTTKSVTVRQTVYAVEKFGILYIQINTRGFYFRETSRRRSFAKIKHSRNGEITLPLFDVVNPVTNLNVALLYFNANCKNKIIAKKSKFTVPRATSMT